MNGPKSIEVARALGWDMLYATAEYKGLPAERNLISEILDGMVSAGFVRDEKGSFPHPFGYWPDRKEMPKNLSKEETDAFIEEQTASMLEWWAESVFVPLSKKARAFLWSTFYAKEWGTAISLGRAEDIKRVAKALGKSGALSDMEAETPEWEEKEDEDDADETEENEAGE